MMSPPFSIGQAAREELTRYLSLFPEEHDRVAPLIELLRTGGDDVWSRKHPPGHLTGSAVIVDAASPRVLLVHHVFLNRWLQPGGHLDAGETPTQAAIREAAEEVGLAGLSPHPWHAENAMPIDIDIHAIPANPKKGEPAHFHHDFRYVFVVDAATATFELQAEEVANLKWESFDGPNIPAGLDTALARVRALL